MRTDAEIRQEGMKALIQVLGTVEAEPGCSPFLNRPLRALAPWVDAKSCQVVKVVINFESTWVVEKSNILALGSHNLLAWPRTQAHLHYSKWALVTKQLTLASG